MKRIIIILFLINNFNLCHGQIVLKKDVSDFSFFYIDHFNNIKDYRAVRNEKREIDGIISLNVDFPVIVTFTKMSTNYPVYLEPGDTCAVSLNKSTAEYVLTGNKSQGEFNFLISLEKKLGFTFPDLSITLSSKVDILEYIKMHQELYDKRINLLDLHRDSLQLSKAFYASMKKIMYYKYLRGALMPFYFIDKDYDYTGLPGEYIKYVSGFNDVMNDSLATDLNYRLFLINYNKFLCKQYLKSNAPYTFEALYTSAKNNFTGKGRDFLMFSLLKENVYKALPGFSNAVLEFKKTCLDPEFVHYIDSVWAKTLRAMPVSATETGVENELSEIFIWKSLIEKSKGNVIYLDFWASWCAPCIAEMPNSVALQNKVDKGKVRFVYISIDSKKDSWIKAMKKLPADVQQSEHYRLDADSELGRFFDLSSIPRYVIIGADGKVAAFNAGRPGSDDTLAAIKKLIELNKEK